MTELTKTLVRSLSRCWPAVRLEAALAIWPAPPNTWAWFLGDRLVGMPRGEADQRLQIAIQAARRARLPKFPQIPTITHWRAFAPIAKWNELRALLALYLDAPDNETAATVGQQIRDLIATDVPAERASKAELVPAPPAPPAPEPSP